MSRISTKIANHGGINKVIQPGNVSVKINSIGLEKSPFKDNPDDPQAYNIIFNVEGLDLGPDFDGFFIDKNDQSKGKHKGAIGKVRVDKWPFKNRTTRPKPDKDGNTPPGKIISRDLEILNFIRNTCTELGLMDWFDKEDNQHESIESLVEKFDTDGLYKDKWLRMCIAGKEYTNKGGFTNFELSLPKFSKYSTPFELESIPLSESRLIVFDPMIHLEKKKAVKTEVINGFGNTPELEVASKRKVNSDFEL